MPRAVRSRLDRLLHDSFKAGILLKGALASLELLSGVLLWAFGPKAVAFAQAVTLQRVTNHPEDRIAGHLRYMAEGFSIQSEHFYALYFASHGLVKLILVAALWREARWAFPTSIVALLGFIAYQLYRYSHTGSLPLLILTAFDIVVIALIWREYRTRQREGLA